MSEFPEAVVVSDAYREVTSIVPKTKSLESEHQHERRSKRLPDNDGIVSDLASSYLFDL